MAERKYKSRDALLQSIGDEANLTDAELQSRLEDYQYRQKNSKTYVDRQKLGNEISTILASNGVSGPEIAGAIQMIGDQVEAGDIINHLPNQEVVNGRNFDASQTGAAYGSILPGMGTAIGAGIGSMVGGSERTAQMNKVWQVLSPILPLINAKIQKGDYNSGDTAKDYDPDIQRINDLLGARKLETENNTALDDYINQYPQELASGTDSFIQAQAAEGRRFFEDQLAPEIGQSQNAKGTLYGGNYLNELNRSASEVRGGLESQALQLQQQDQAFFADLAYQNTLRKAIQAGQDVTAQIATQRNSLETQKQQSFNMAQADVNNMFNNQLFMRQNERALAGEQARLRSQQAQANKKNQAQLYSGIGSAVGGIAGAVVGGPVGAAAGSAAGGAAAGGLTNR